MRFLSIILLCILMLGLIGCSMNTESNQLNNEHPEDSTESSYISESGDEETGVNTNNENETILSTNCQLIVYGEDITAGNHAVIEYDKGRIELPLIAIIKAMGGEIEWKDKANAAVILNKHELMLNIEEHTLVDIENGHDYLEPILEYWPEPFTLGDELIVDDDYIRELLPLADARMLVDHISMIVTIRSNEDFAGKSHKLIVNGEDVTGDNYIKIHYSEDYAELPLVPIINALGGEVEWSGGNNAVITLYDSKYYLDIENGTLTDEDEREYFTELSGYWHGESCKIEDDQIIVNSNLLYFYINSLRRINLKIDFDSPTVTIDDR